MTLEERPRAVIDCGFTERQARFLVLVMRHAGVCVPRQYASFAGIANGGRRCNAFFDRLVRRGYAHEIRCVHNRARVYHVHHKPLYFLIGDVSSRYRRPVSPGLAVERLMLLDAVLDVGDVDWVTTAPERDRNLEEWRQLGRQREGKTAVDPQPEPTLEDVRREYEPSPINEEEEVTELVGLCLWDVFSDNHDVIAADGRLADIGSFRAAGAFLDEHLTRDQEGWRDGDYLRFYLGTIWIHRRADLTPVYAMIFRRLKAVGADWVYHFPELGIIELAPTDDDTGKPDQEYSVSQAAVAELEAQQRRAEVERFRAELRETNARAREEAMDRPPPTTVRAYRQVYGRDPRGWPPA
jgi:hypothetical protein